MAKRKKNEGHRWLLGQAEMERVYGDLAERRRQWMTIAMISMVVSIVLSIGMVTLATSDRNIPWIVEVDQLGAVRVSGEAGEQVVPDHAKIAALHKVVRYMREIPADVRLLQARHTELASHLTGAALAQFAADIGENSEELTQFLEAGARRYVEDITSVLPFPAQPGLYRVTWAEGQVGAGALARAYEGHFQVITGPPPAEDGALHNPLGIYIAEYSISPITTSSP